MSAIIIEDETVQRLSSLCKMTELRSEEGKLIGHFVPADPIFPWAPELTADEMERRRKADPGKPLAEIIKRLTGS